MLAGTGLIRRPPPIARAINRTTQRVKERLPQVAQRCWSSARHLKRWDYKFCEKARGLSQHVSTSVTRPDISRRFKATDISPRALSREEGLQPYR